MNKDVCYAKRRSAGQGVGVFLLKRKRVGYSCLPYPLTLNFFCVLARTPFKEPLSRSYIFLYIFLAKKKNQEREKKTCSQWRHAKKTMSFAFC